MGRLAVQGGLFACGLELDRGGLLSMAVCFFRDRSERAVGHLESPFDVLVRVLRGKERPFARVRDAEQDVVPEAMDEPVPPAPGVRAERVAEVPDLVLCGEVHVPDRPDVFDPGRDATIVREVLEAAEELPAEAIHVFVIFRMLPEDLDRLQASRDPDWMSVVGARMEGRVPPPAARFEGLHDLRFASETRELESAARDLPEGRHIRADVVVFLGAPVREAESRQDLIEDEDDLPLPGELSEALQA